MRKSKANSEHVLRALIREYNLFGGLGSLTGLDLFGTGAGSSGLNLFGSQYIDEPIVSTGLDVRSFDARPSDGQLTAAVIGDSQSGGALGSAIERRLRDAGFSPVMRSHRNGATGAQVVSEQAPAAFAGSDLVVAIFGGNDSSVGTAIRAAEDLYDLSTQAGSYLVIVGPAPVTMITDTRLAGDVFAGTIGPDPAPDAWFTHDGGRYADLRVSISRALEDSMAGKTGVAAYGIAAKMSPSDYPDQPDGIHIYNGADAIASDIFDSIGMSQIVSDIKGSAPDVEIQRDGAQVPFDYDRWLHEISKIEGNYGSINPDTVALGKYQFVPYYWWDEIKAFAGHRLPDTHEVTRYTRKGKPIYSDYEAFLKDHQLQEDWMRHYTMNYAIAAAQTLRREFPEKTANRSDGQLAALYHFQGLGGARDWFGKGVMRGRDVNAINPDQYMDRVT